MKNALLSINEPHDPDKGKLIVISETGKGQDIYVAKVNPNGTWTYMRLQNRELMEGERVDMNQYFFPEQGVNLRYCAEWPLDKKEQIKLLFKVPQNTLITIQDGKDYIVSETNDIIIMTRKDGLLMINEEKTAAAKEQKEAFVNQVIEKIGPNESSRIAREIALNGEFKLKNDRGAVIKTVKLKDDGELDAS
jgi:hypothetical protein